MKPKSTMKYYAALAAITLAGATSSQAALTITNGTFDTGVADWTPSGVATLQWQPGPGFHAVLVASSHGAWGANASTVGTTNNDWTGMNAGDTITISLDAWAPHLANDLAFDVDLVINGANVGTTLSISLVDLVGSVTNFSTVPYAVSVAEVGAADDVSVRFTPATTGAGGVDWDQTAIDNVVVTVTPVPEPSAAALFGLAGLALILRRRK